MLQFGTKEVSTSQPRVVVDTSTFICVCAVVSTQVKRAYPAHVLIVKECKMSLCKTCTKTEDDMWQPVCLICG